MGDDNIFLIKQKANAILGSLDYLDKIRRNSFLLYKSRVDGLTDKQLIEAQRQALIFLEHELKNGDVGEYEKIEIEESISFFKDRREFEHPIENMLERVTKWFMRR